MNIPPGCPALNAEDDRRRAELKKHMEETREVIFQGDSLSDALWMLRERAKINAQHQD